MPHLRYEQHTWPELAELAARDDVVVVIPTATLEDHGHHLPIDTDVRLIEEVARGACEHVNAHGSNQPLVDIAARLVNVEHPSAICASCWYLVTPESKRLLEELRESGG